MLLLRCLCWLCLGLLTSPLWGQDLHFSQFYRPGLYLNPAMTGLYEGDVRFSGLYRSQWQAVPVPYQTFNGQVDMKVPDVRFGPGKLAVGLVLNADEAGDALMRWLQAGLSGAYLLPIEDQWVWSNGVQALWANRTFQPSLLTFNEQFQGDIFNASAASGEALLNSSVNIFSLAAGSSLAFQHEYSRSFFTVGVAGYHLNRPEPGFYDAETITIPIRWNAHAHGGIEVSDNLDLNAGLLWRMQNAYREYLGGVGITYHLSIDNLDPLAIGFDMQYRWGDALIPVLRLQYGSWEAGLSYDVNISEFSAATNRRGGPEVFVQYVIKRPAPPPVFKACPIF
jgi:type IX secretion system PorP/SprF family membrane protein